MKRSLFILPLIIFCFAVFGQQNNGTSFCSLYTNPFEGEQNLSAAENIDLFLSTAQNTDLSVLNDYKADLHKFVEKQTRRKEKSKDDDYFVKNLFYAVHNKFLKHYDNYVTFDDIFSNGSYDCVTGTALYALILQELGYDLQIYESNFHVFLLVNLENRKILIESTDFYTGYVEDAGQIASRIEHYQLANNEAGKNVYAYETNNSNFITPRQLAGLLYFNLSVEQYNKQNFDNALGYLKKAESLYESHRTMELKNLITKMIFASNSFSLQK